MPQVAMGWDEVATSAHNTIAQAAFSKFLCFYISIETNRTIFEYFR
jgi:hypothetical protein